MSLRLPYDQTSEKAFARDIAKAEARIAQLTAALKAVEWRGPHGYCPLCLADKDEGSGRHAPECIVGKALKP